MKLNNAFLVFSSYAAYVSNHNIDFERLFRKWVCFSVTLAIINKRKTYFCLNWIQQESGFTDQHGDLYDDVITAPANDDATEDGGSSAVSI